MGPREHLYLRCCLGSSWMLVSFWEFC
uniref:Uncharacterized protein n=1 Tax=Rhizophora mucronata TaxID=61149 RepID=A0A2P2QXK4_RHIMU